MKEIKYGLFTYSNLIQLLKIKNQFYDIKLRYDDDDGYEHYYNITSIVSSKDYTTEIVTVADYIRELESRLELESRQGEYETDDSAVVLSNTKRLFNIEKIITKTMEYPNGRIKDVVVLVGKELDF